jgi:hypothetical protein
MALWLQKEFYFDAKKEVMKFKSWEQATTDAEVEETEPLMTRIRALQAAERKELLGVQIITYFLRLCIQPMQGRVSRICSYSGLEDKSRVPKEAWPEGDLEKLVQRLTMLTKKHRVPSSCLSKPYDFDLNFLLKHICFLYYPLSSILSN